MRSRRVPQAWPVMLCAAVLVAVTLVVALRLDADRASIQPERYARFLESTRGVSP